jgi:hypothetical protein
MSNIFVHPTMRARYAKDSLRDAPAEITEGRLGFLNGRVSRYRMQLEELGVAPERIAIETAALEMIFFGGPSPLRLRTAPQRPQRRRA